MTLAQRDDAGELRESGLDDRLERTPAVGDDLALRMYREMKRLRLLDRKLETLQRQGRIGFYGSCTGQEAAPVAAGLAVADGDWIFPALREGGAMLVRGAPLSVYVAQVFGNRADRLKGRQMPSHMSSRSVHHVSWSSCIGTQLPHAVGAAWGAKLRGDPIVTLAFLGDGATSTSDFHGAMNFAGVFRLPVVFVCQNNQYAISVPVSRQTASSTLSIKAQAYGIEFERIDGNDVLSVHEALKGRIGRARQGAGPAFLELVTYRMAPHSTSDDPTRYRSAAEVESWAEKDPIARLGAHLEGRGLLGGSEGRGAADIALEAELSAEIDQTIAEIEIEPRPSRDTLFDDVYAELPWHLVEQRAELRGAEPSETDLKTMPEPRPNPIVDRRTRIG